MITIKDCTIRYWIGPDTAYIQKAIDRLNEYVHSDYYTKWMPLMFVENDGEYWWAYCTFPLPDVEIRLIRSLTGIDLSAFKYEELEKGLI